MKMKKLSTFLLAIFSVIAIQAQQLQPVSKIHELVEQRKAAGETFKKTLLFAKTETSVAQRRDLQAEVRKGTILKVSKTDINSLLNSHQASLELEIPISASEKITLELVQANIFDAAFSVRTSGPTEFADANAASHFWGTVKGHPNRLAAISIFEDEVMGLITDRTSNLVIGKLQNTDEHIIYEDTELTNLSEFTCATPDDGRVYPEAELQDVHTTLREGSKCVKLYIEVDKDIHDNKGGLQNTLDYVTGIFTQHALLFANENIDYQISEIFVWTTPSPYTGQNSTSQLLSTFQNQSNDFNGDLAILLSYRGSGGVAAGFSGFCNPNRAQSMCYAGINSTYSNVPTYSWTVMVFAHELGHLMGSRHTHACVWNGNGTAIDGCAGFVEGSCFLPGIPSGGGTIMSYCHLTGAGINFNLGFGPQPGNVIRNNVMNAACLSVCGDDDDDDDDDLPPSCTNGIKDRTENGIDCGGICPPCGANPTCNDGIQNGGETGVDCGGPNCPPCPTCNDGIQNGGETGVDCGGPNCPPCPTCNDGIQNGDEQGVDCGGANCPPCDSNPTCNDGIQNGDEQGVDCGGSCPPCQSTCIAPAGLVATNITFNSVTLRWNAASTATNYTARYRGVGANTWTQTTVSATQLSLNRLSPNATYEWQVRSNCTGGNSDWSFTCTFKLGQPNSSNCGTGLTNPSIAGIQVFPNPAKDFLEIQVGQVSGGDPSLQLRLTDTMGRTVRQMEIDSSSRSHRLDVSTLANGMYYVKIENDTVSYLTKIVIQK